MSAAATHDHTSCLQTGPPVDIVGWRVNGSAGVPASLDPWRDALLQQ